MKVLIVDDEPLARLRLQQLLAEAADVEVVGEAGNAADALSKCEELRPDLLLLDVQMPGVDGLTLARRSDLPPIIFTTAHPEFALDAFEVSAVDYVTKPITKERLFRALEKARSRRLTDVLRDLQTAGRPVRIPARHQETYEIFDAREITRFFASEKYVVFLSAGREMLLEQSLNELEAMLEGHDFMRVHRGELINLGSVKRLSLEGRSCTVELSDGQRVQVSRRLIPELKKKLGL